jgi:sugar phosphate isomerase/epimerase
MTFHPGAMPPDYTLPQLRDLIRASLEYLLPYAEKYGVIMCIENAMRPTNTPDELLRYLKEFDTPWLGCTYDTGHANVMSSFNGTKDPAKYSEKFLAIWPDGVVFEDHALDKLAPYVVVSHVHNNNGYKDEHRFIDDGALDWKPIIRKLKYDCPRIQNIENETKVFEHLISMTRIGQDFAKLIAEA